MGHLLTHPIGTVPLAGETITPFSENAGIQIAQLRSADEQRNFFKSASLTIPAVFASMVDTFGTSLGLLEDDTVDDFLKKNMSGLGSFREDNEGAIGAVADIVGSFIPGTLAIKAVRAGGIFTKLANKVVGPNAAKYITSTGLSNPKLFEANFQRARKLASKGAGRIEIDDGLRALNRRKLARSVGDVVVENVAADAAIVATMSQSDFLFPPEISMVENLMFFGAFNVAFGAAGFAAAKFSLTRGLNEAAGGAIGKVQNPSRRPILDAQGGIIDQRGPRITTLSALLDDHIKQTAQAQSAGDKELAQNGLKTISSLQAQLTDEFVRLFRDSPIEGVTANRALDDAAPEITTMQAAIANDWQALSGVRALEAFDSAAPLTMAIKLQTKRLGLEAEIKTLRERVRILRGSNDRVSKKTLQQQRAQLQKVQDEWIDIQSTVAMVFELDGTVFGAIGRQEVYQDGSRAISLLKGGFNETKVGERVLRSNAEGAVDLPSREFTIDDLDDIIAGKVETTAIKSDSFLSMSHKEKTAAHDLLQQSAERIEKNGVEKWAGMSLNSASHHTQFDFAARLVEGPQGREMLNKIDVIGSLDELYYGALNSKWKDFQLMRNKAAKAQAAGQDDIYQNMENVATALNMPRDNDLLLQMFEGSRVEYGKNIDNILPFNVIGDNMQAVRDQLLKAAEAAPADTLNGALTFRGEMQNLPRDRRPVMAVLRNDERPMGAGRQQLREQVLAVRAKMVNTLEASGTKFDANGNMLKPGSLMVAAIMQVFRSQPAMLKAAKDALPKTVQTIDYDTIANQVVTQAFRLRDVYAARPLDLMAELTNKAMEKVTENLLKAPSQMMKGTVKDAFGNDTVEYFAHQEVFNKLLRGDSESDLLSFATARNALSQGWDVSAKAVSIKQSDGSFVWQFPLDSASDRNKALYRQRFGKDMPTENAMLPATQQSPSALTVTELGYRAVESVDALQQQLLRETNAIRSARNQREITAKAFHMPINDFSDDFVVYLLNDAGKVRTMKGGKTLQQARTLAAREQEISDVPLYIVDESNIQLYTEAKSRAWFDLTDFSAPSKQTGPSTGKATGQLIETGGASFKNMLESTLRAFSDIGRETRSLMFDPELQFLKLQEARAGFNPKEGRNVYNLLTNRILGTRNITADSIPGKLLIGFESSYDKLMQRVFDNLEGVRGLAKDVGFGGKRAGVKGFEQLNARLEPQHNPFQDMNDFLERTQNVKIPSQLRKHAGALGEITTALTIRIFDVGMGVINMASLISTLPPVINMLKRQANETSAQHLNRIAAFGSATPGGLAYFSPTRAVISGTQFFFSKEGRAMAKVARDKGYFDQFAAEQVEIYSRTGEQFLPGLLRSASNKASIITDKTERLARAVSFMTFLNIGKKGMGLQDEAAMAFAHAQANNVIADFRPTNRPVIFQGAAGMPFALFTTFMWNYLQRVYSIVETRNISAAINQFGLQTAFFGARSVPGAPEMLEDIGTMYGDGSQNIVDRFQRAFGPATTDLFMNGALQTFTGVSIAQRASIGIPGTNGFGLSVNAAGIRLFGKLWDTSMAEVDAAVTEGGIDPVRAAEILARSNINKGVTNMIDLALGRSLDANGNVLEEFTPLGEALANPVENVLNDTRTRMAIGARILGFKPALTVELQRENRRNRVTDRIRNEIKSTLADNLRSKIINGRLRSDDVESALGTYVKAGGNPENFRRYFQNQVVHASTNKLSKEVVKALNNSADQGRIARLLFLMGQEAE